VHSQQDAGKSTTSKTEIAGDLKDRKESFIELNKGPTIFARFREVIAQKEAAQNEYDPTMHAKLEYE